MMYNQQWMPVFLDRYQADTSPDKRLDFISYHAYGEFPPGDATISAAFAGIEVMKPGGDDDKANPIFLTAFVVFAACLHPVFAENPADRNAAWAKARQLVTPPFPGAEGVLPIVNPDPKTLPALNVNQPAGHQGSARVSFTFPDVPGLICDAWCYENSSNGMNLSLIGARPLEHGAATT